MMMPGTRPGDSRAQQAANGPGYPGLPGYSVQPGYNPGLPQRHSAVRSQSYTNSGPRPLNQAQASASDGQLDSRAGVLLPPNMFMSMAQGQMPRGLPQVPVSLPQMLTGLSQLPGGMPQIPAGMIPNMGQYGDLYNTYNMVIPPSPHTSIVSPLPKATAPLMNVDISSSNFLKVMNFDGLSNRATGSGDTGELRDREEDQGEDGFSQYSQSEDGDYMEHSMASDTAADQLEHHQAKAQAQLLERFKQLRDWQTSQQEMLVRQQQDQLAQLRDEQTRVQRIIVKQREQQWGGNGPAPGAPKSSVTSPPRPVHNKPPPHPHSTLPQAVVQGTLALSRLNRGQQPAADNIPQPTTPQKGRPVPNIMSGPSTPVEYMEYGNPALDSDNNTIASGTPLEDGIQRLADTASECSEAPGISSQYFQSRSKPELPEEEKQKRANSVKKFGPPIPFPHVDEGGVFSKPRSLQADLAEAQSMQQNHMALPQFQMQNQAVFRGNALPQLQQNGAIQHPNPHVISNIRQLVPPGSQVEKSQNQILDFRENGQHDVDVADSDFQSVVTSEGFQIQEEEETQEEEESELQEEEEEEHYDNESEVEELVDLEDKPVAGAAKTFEQLLEEELQKEEARLRAGEVQQDSVPKSTQRKAFLKRGEGTSRFDSQIRKPPVRKPALKQPKVSANSKPPAKKLNEPETNSNKKELMRKKKSEVRTKTSPPGKLVLKAPAPRQSVSPRKPTTAGSKPPTNKNKPTQPTASDAKTKPRDSTGEMSFQKCMQDHQVHEEVETEELEEFEILEQYADDNASFLSNMSTVNKVVQVEKKAKSSQGVMSARTTTSQKVQFTATPQIDDDLSGDEEDSDDEHHNATLTGSSPEKYDDMRTSNNYLSSGNSVSEHQVSRTLQRKVSSMGNRSPQKLRPAEAINKVTRANDSDSDTWEEFEGPNHVQDQGHVTDSDQSESTEEGESESESEEERLNVKDIIMNSKLNDVFAQKGRNHNIEAQEQINVPLLHGSEQSSPPHSHAPVVNHSHPPDYGDDEEWDQSPHKGQPAASGPIVKTKVFTDEIGSGDSAATTPPTSKLVTKLFPKLKPEQPKQPPITVQQEQQFTSARHAALGDGVQSKALRDKLTELEKEIERFRTENANLESLRREREQGLDHIKKEMTEFEKQKAEELQQLQNFKNEEMKKLKKEKRVFEQYQKASRSLPDKKEREEIETLKKQVTELQDELRRKEQRWTASSKRLRDRVESLEQENSELKDEIKVLEKKRLEAWQHQEAAANTKRGDIQKSESQLSAQSIQPSVQNIQPSRQSIQPSGQSSQAPGHTTQPVYTAAPRDNVVTISYNTDVDNDSEFPDSVSQAAVNLNITNDESLIMQTAPQAMSHSLSKHLTSSPHQNGVSEPVSAQSGSSGRSNLPRKTAIPASISRAIDKGDEKYEEMQHPDGKIERIYNNGAREILFSNGTRKQVSADGQSIIVSFFNGDIKQIMPDQRVVYYYADAQTTHTTYPDGLEIIQFPNNQIEKHYPDGTREITFPDQIIKYLFPTGVEESIFPDGTVIRVERNGDKVMEFPNGQREIHTPQYKRREYPDGTVKTVYPDGRQETRYSSGRVRVKDREGQIIVDKRM